MFKGVFTALVTPFLKNKKVDYIALQQLLLLQSKSAVNGVVLLGTTAEECTLTQSECENIIYCAKKLLKNKKVIVGISGNNTQEVVRKVVSYEKFEVDGYLIGTPYYNKPTTNGLVKHFSEIAAATSRPIMLYNIPGRCGVKLDFEALNKLKEINNIVAIKEASGDIDYFTRLISEFKDRFDILCGNDNIFLPMLACGAVGCVSVASNILPEIITKIYENFTSNIQNCIFLHNKFIKFANILFLETNPMCVKYILYKYGYCNNILRSPLTSIKRSTKYKIDKLLETMCLYTIK